MWRWLLLISLWCGAAQAEAALHMSFHMALASEGQRFVGVTLVNQGEGTVAQGYVVITPIDAQCRPLSSVMGTFGAVAPKQKISMRVPISESFRSYRLASVAGFDEQGFVVPAIDDNAAILQLREGEERTYCAQARAKAEWEEL